MENNATNFRSIFDDLIAENTNQNNFEWVFPSSSFLINKSSILNQGILTEQHSLLEIQNSNSPCFYCLTIDYFVRYSVLLFRRIQKLMLIWF